MNFVLGGIGECLKSGSEREASDDRLLEGGQILGKGCCGLSTRLVLLCWLIPHAVLGNQYLHSGRETSRLKLWDEIRWKYERIQTKSQPSHPAASIERQRYTSFRFSLIIRQGGECHLGATGHDGDVGDAQRGSCARKRSTDA
jgi:hypothetical protein